MVTITPSGQPTWARSAHICDYGGDVNKTDKHLEKTPYAWSWYRECRAARGSAYAQERTTLVHVENMAMARCEMARSRAAEKFVANSIPSTSDERLAYWCEILGVTDGPQDTDSAIRAKCAGKYRSAVGPTIAAEDEAIAALLGAAFVRCWRQEGVDLATPPAITYWPVIAPGPASHDLGGGCWLSERAHLVVEVTQPATMTTTAFLRLVNVDLFELLDTMLPAWATFNWAIGVTTGFVLDVDELDFHGMGP